MIAGLIYGLIAAGFCAETDKIWQSVFWPYYLGRAIARTVLDVRGAPTR